MWEDWNHIKCLAIYHRKKACHLCFVLGSADGGSWGDGVETWKRCSWNLSLVLLWWAKHLDFQMREKVVPCNYRCAYIEAEGHKGAMEHWVDTGTVSKTCWGNFWKRWWSIYGLSQACTSHLELNWAAGIEYSVAAAWPFSEQPKREVWPSQLNIHGKWPEVSAGTVSKWDIVYYIGETNRFWRKPELQIHGIYFLCDTNWPWFQTVFTP